MGIKWNNPNICAEIAVSFSEKERQLKTRELLLSFNRKVSVCVLMYNPSDGFAPWGIEHTTQGPENQNLLILVLLRFSEFEQKNQKQSRATVSFE